MADYGAAIKRPFTDWRGLILGIVLSILPIVNFFAVGYFVQCAKTAMSKNFTLPKWEKWGDLFVTGLLVFIIGLVWTIPLIIVGVFTVGAVLITFLTGDFSALAGLGAGLVGFAILAIITMYFVPSAILNFASSGRLAAGFQFGTIFKKTFTSSYFVTWLVMVVYSVIVSAILGFIPFAGSPIAFYITQVAFYTALGEVY